MRERIFRGKDTNNGEWVQGYYSELPIGSIGATIFANSDEIISEDTDSFIIKITTKQCSSLSPSNPLEVVEAEYIKVIPETICEYTDLTDSKGNKIFEGDIVKITDELVDGIYYARVEFGNPNAQYNWGFQLVPLCKTPFAVDILHWVDMEESGAFIEVIGNIYDNPELLKVINND